MRERKQHEYESVLCVHTYSQIIPWGGVLRQDYLLCLVPGQDLVTCSSHGRQSRNKHKHVIKFYGITVIFTLQAASYSVGRIQWAKKVSYQYGAAAGW